MELSSSLHRSALHRPRKSPWPVIPMENAWSILDEQFTQYLDQLRDIEEKRANQPDLLGYILAESLHSFRPVPPFRASIKDGYALIAADGPGPHRVVSICTAGGQQEKGEIEGAMKCAGYKECVRISTGAKVPDWTDAVVPVEETTILEDDGQEELIVNIGEIAKKGQNIREIGSDVAQGELLLEKGTVIGPAEIGLVALSGKRKILVYSKPKMSIISTGDELVDFYGAEQNNEEPLIEAVMDTNRPVLLSLIRQNGFDGIDGGIVEDSQFALIEAIERSFGQVDLVVLTGGVSMGEKDLLKDILVNKFHFKIHFGRVFMKPGLPTTFASGQGPDGRQKFVFGLPGNPVSAFVTAHLFLLPQLRRIAGFDEDWQNARFAVQLSHPIGQLDPRPEYRRAILLRPQIGQPPSSPPLAQCIFGSQISSRLLSTRSANLLLELPPKNAQKDELEKGEIITALVIGPII